MLSETQEKVLVHIYDMVESEGSVPISKIKEISQQYEKEKDAMKFIAYLINYTEGDKVTSTDVLKAGSYILRIEEEKEAVCAIKETKYGFLNEQTNILFRSDDKVGFVAIGYLKADKTLPLNKEKTLICIANEWHYDKDKACDIESEFAV